MPGIGRESRKLELDRQAGTAGPLEQRDVSVDAVRKRRQYRLGIRRVAQVLLVHVAPVLQGARVDVALQGGRSENFAEPSLTSALPHFHLKQAILGGDHSLCKEKVVLVLRVNVCDTPFVAQNTHRLAQTWHVQLA